MRPAAARGEKLRHPFAAAATKDGLFLNAPYAENEIRLDDDLRVFFMHKTVCGGMLQRLTASSSLWREIEPGDYYRREELAVGKLGGAGGKPAVIQKGDKPDGALHGVADFGSSASPCDRRTEKSTDWPVSSIERTRAV